MSEAVERELGWNDPIEHDGEFVLLEPGDYNFNVVGFERGRHNGSAKLPACNKAVIEIDIDSDKGPVRLKHNLFLHTKTEGLLCQFFIGIGLRKHGEKVNMDWNRVIGSNGRCKVAIRKWTSDKGIEMESNQISKFYDPDENPPQQAEQQAPAGWDPNGGGLPF
jgi:hypothetical protein